MMCSQRVKALDFQHGGHELESLSLHLMPETKHFYEERGNSGLESVLSVKF